MLPDFQVSEDSPNNGTSSNCHKNTLETYCILIIQVLCLSATRFESPSGLIYLCILCTVS